MGQTIRGTAEGSGHTPDAVIDIDIDFDVVASSGSVTLQIAGQVYGRRPDDILADYLAHGVDALTRLDGSFLLQLQDEEADAHFLLTDPVGTRACYVWRHPETSLITHSLDRLPKDRIPLDPGGIASYLVGDGTRAGLTPYQGVSSLGGGSIIDVRKAMKVDRYWRVPAEAEAPSDRPGDDLLQLFRSSVQRRIEALRPERVLLSLSGGVDSKGLLGLLIEVMDPGSIDSFTYFHGEQYGDMDLHLAQKAAEAAGVRHRAIAGYRGDPIATLVDNALTGQGVAHFCDDADVWRLDLGGEHNTVVVTGDRQSHHLWAGPDDLSMRGLLSLVSFHSSETARWLFDRLPPETSLLLTEAWDTTYSEVENELSTGLSWREMTSRAYVEQRLHPTLTLWRELFCSRAGVVTSPFIDRDVLDFVARLPVELNAVDGDFLHRQVLESAFPKLFSGPLAHGGWNMPVWGRELASVRSDVARLLETVPSRLDGLIPTDVILGLLDEQTETFGTARGGWKGTLRRLAKQNPAVVRLVRRRKLRRSFTRTSVASPSHMARRLLTLRGALSAPEDLLGFLEERSAPRSR